MFFKKKVKKFNFLDKIEDISENIHLKKTKKRPFLFFKYFFGFVAIIILLVIILVAIVFFRFKNVYTLAVSGNASLEYSVEAGKRKDFLEMSLSSLKSEKYFLEIVDELEFLKKSFFIKNTDFANKQITEAIYLVESLAIISNSLNLSAELASEMENILSGNLGTNFSEFSDLEKERLLKMLYESAPEINGAKANLDLALLNLNKIHSENVLAPVKEKIKSIRGQITKAVESLSSAMLVSQIAPGFLGYPQKSSFLVLFQNSTELRATGGFIGTYGILEIKNGDILRFDTHDIYHMDMPLEKIGNFQIVPPLPIAKYLNKNWYMRDANWAPHFPASARQVEWFYHQENKLLPEENQINNFSDKFDGVIAINPEFVLGLLETVGSVSIKGEEFNANNFMDILQERVERDFVSQDITSWQRKAIVGDILEELKQKIFDLDFQSWASVYEKINKSIKEKDILVYSNDNYLQKLIKDIGVAGEIKDALGDYLMVVDSNMAALKTDAVIGREIKYNIVETVNGYVGRLKIDYAHDGTRDWKTDDYKSYTRVYIPRGSKLIKTEGFSTKPVIKNEFDKTSVGGLLNVRVGRSASIYLEYVLPDVVFDYIKENGYTLYIQKQPGNITNNLELDVELVNKVKSYNLKDTDIEAKLINESRVKWNTNLKIDREFKINF